jgi:hypothetical protein
MTNFQASGDRPALPAIAPAQDGDLNPGSSMAALWIQVSQSDQPPASIPSTLAPSAYHLEKHPESCPKCKHRLNPPLKTSGRQVCVKCGWSDKPRNLLQEGGAIREMDLRQLLEQAAVESLDNMKPRKQQA